MLQFTPVQRGKGVSDATRDVPIPSLALDPADNLYVAVSGGIGIMRRNATMVEQFCPADPQKIVRDGNITNHATIGGAYSLSWDDDLLHPGIARDNLFMTLERRDTLKFGGLWFVDMVVPGLRLIVGDQVRTIVGSPGAPYRDGISRISNVDDDDGEELYASFTSPMQCHRMNRTTKVVIIEGFTQTITSRIRILDMSNWTVKTLAFAKPLPFIGRSFKHHDCLFRDPSFVTPNKLMLTTISSPAETSSTVLDLTTEKLDPHAPGIHPTDHDYAPFASNTPLYAMESNMSGVTTVMYTFDGRQIGMIEEAGSIAYVAAIKSIVRVNRQGVSISKNCFPSEKFPPWKVHSPVEDVSLLINNNLIPGYEVFTHKATGRSWRVHGLVLDALWSTQDTRWVFDTKPLGEFIKKSTALPVDVIDTFIRLLHHAPVFDGLETKAKLALALKMLYLASVAKMEEKRLLPWFIDFLKTLPVDLLHTTLIDTWNDTTTTPWNLDDHTILCLVIEVGLNSMDLFLARPDINTPGKVRDANKLSAYVVRGNSSVYQYGLELSGLRRGNISWYPIKPADGSPSVQKIVQSIPSELAYFSSSAMTSGNSLEDLEHFANDCIFVLANYPYVARAITILCFLRWPWFRRQLELPKIAKRERIFKLPSWVTPSICTAIIDSIMCELHSDLSIADMSALLTHGHELELWPSPAGPAHGVFGKLLTRCSSTLLDYSLFSVPSSKATPSTSTFSFTPTLPLDSLPL